MENTLKIHIMLNHLYQLFDRDLRQLANEVDLYPADEALWRSAPGISNPGGNLILHLCGNLRHYIGFRLGQIDYQRDRSAEFSRQGLPRAELLTQIDLARAAVSTLTSLSPDSLDETYEEEVFGHPMTTGFFLTHLYGHLRYHMGQVNYHRRMLDA